MDDTPDIHYSELITLRLGSPKYRVPYHILTTKINNITYFYDLMRQKYYDLSIDIENYVAYISEFSSVSLKDTETNAKVVFIRNTNLLPKPRMKSTRSMLK